MKRKMYLKQKNKPKKTLAPIIIITTITLFIIIKYTNKKISPKLINYATLETQKLSRLIITKSISLESIETLNINDLFIITKNENNEIMTVDMNTVLINKIIQEITINIQENLKKLEEGKINNNNEENKNGVILKIPLGQITNNFIFNNLGPQIPVKLKILGEMKTQVNSTVKNYGINNALIEITLDITIKEEVLLPISSDEIEVSTTIPIAMKLINGTVPSYYSNGINKTQELSIPLE